MQSQGQIPTYGYAVSLMFALLSGTAIGYVIGDRTATVQRPVAVAQPDQSGSNEILAQLSRMETAMAETERRLVAVEAGPADTLSAAPAAQPATAPLAAIPAAPTVAPAPAAAPAATGDAALATLTGDDIDIFAAPDGSTLAFIRPTKQWMKFDAQGVPTEIDAASVPAETRTAALARAAANTPTVQPVGDIDAGIAAAEQASADLADPTPDLAINQLLAQPDIAGKIVDALDRLGSIDVPGAGSKTRIFVFFDPRCPYCHRAFTALDGKVTMTWIPALALGDDADGQSRAAAILGTVTESTDASGKRSVALADDDDRLTRLRDAMNGKAPAASATLTEAGRFLLDENMTVMNQLYGRQTHLLGVPTIIQTNPDGSAIAYRGYDEATVNEIIERDQKAASATPTARQPTPETAPGTTPATEPAAAQPTQPAAAQITTTTTPIISQPAAPRAPESEAAPQQ